ncbi:hypothetical protein D3C81_787670 [compost metagenome]
MADDAGQVNGRFDTGVATAHHRHALALEQRAIAVRAVRHALVAVLVLARDVHLPPACAGGQDHALGLQRGTVFQLHFDQAIGTGRHQLGGALQVHDVHVVLAHMGFQRAGQLRAFGVLHRDEVLDGHGVEHLAAETFGGNAGADALARGIDRRCRAGRATAHHQHVEGILGLDLLGFAGNGAGVELGDDLLQAHAAGIEHLATLEHHRYRHHLALLHFLLEGAAFDHGGADLRIHDRHQCQRLHHVRAVVAGQRHIDVEVELAIDGLDAVDHVLLDLRRMAAGPQQGQHQRFKLVAQGQAGETHAVVLAFAGDDERGLARIVAGIIQRDLAVAGSDDVGQQAAHVLAGAAVVERGDQAQRLAQQAHVLLQLGLEAVVEHEQLLR